MFQNTAKSPVERGLGASCYQQPLVVLPANRGLLGAAFECDLVDDVRCDRQEALERQLVRAGREKPPNQSGDRNGHQNDEHQRYLPTLHFGTPSVWRGGA